MEQRNERVQRTVTRAHELLTIAHDWADARDLMVLAVAAPFARNAFVSCVMDRVARVANPSAVSRIIAAIYGRCSPSMFAWLIKKYDSGTSYEDRVKLFVRACDDHNVRMMRVIADTYRLHEYGTDARDGYIVHSLYNAGHRGAAAWIVKRFNLSYADVTDRGPLLSIAHRVNNHRMMSHMIRTFGLSHMRVERECAREHIPREWVARLYMENEDIGAVP